MVLYYEPHILQPQIIERMRIGLVINREYLKGIKVVKLVKLTWTMLNSHMTYITMPISL